MASETKELPKVQDAMSAHAIWGHLGELRSLIGIQCDATASVSANSYSSSEPAHISIYPLGVCGHGDDQFFKAETWPEAFKAAYEWASTRKPIERERAIRRMALDIIDITDAEGSCSAYALRRRGSYVEELVEAACQRAGEMSGNAPFSVGP
ncbi:hypothetical protein [Roseomonas chloroacetimidivorans]|uniref:hypothetical protein n=1 Tax=Roseomonas chloroacetimidivorans TaxID=1766656 RepID=UPI003C7446E2